MQDLENNIDDLLRNAAKNYQIHHGKSDWHDILPRLNEPVVDLDNAKKTNPKKYRKLSILLASLFLSGVVFTIITIEKGVTKEQWFNNEKHKSAERLSKEKQEHKSNFNYREPIKKQEIKIEPKNSLSLSSRHLPRNDRFLSDNKFKSFHKNEIASIDTLQRRSAKMLSDDNKNINQRTTVSVRLNDSIIDRKINEKSSLAVVSKTREPRIYVGFIAGPTFNQVKSQGMKKPGFDVGLKIEFNVSEKASVETGVSLNKKYYFTEAKYFSMDKISAAMPPQMKVMSIEGSATVIEVPVSFKYDVLCKNKTAFFSSLGLSSYLLMNEKNNYHAMMNGTAENITSSYKKSSRYLAAALTISIGAENKIRNNNKIRVEPYVQIPLKGIGVGTLPVMSAGLHIGYTLPLR